MPLTFAHPAAVLPLRRVLWLPGLVAGSVVPDMAYYLPLPAALGSTHSVAGLVGIDLLLGVALLSVGYAALAPVLALCPAPWRCRVGRPELTAIGRPRPRAAALAVVSIVVGAATHLIWDAFTHTDGVVVRQWAPLREAVVGPHRVYNVVGYVSSLGGLLLVAVALARLGRSAGRRPGKAAAWPALPLAVRAAVLVGFAVASVAGAVVALADPVSQVSSYDWVRQLLIGGVQGVPAALAVHVIAWYAVAAARAVHGRLARSVAGVGTTRPGSASASRHSAVWRR